MAGRVAASANEDDESADVSRLQYANPKTYESKSMFAVEGQQAQGERDRKGEGGHEAGTSFSQRRGDAEKRGETAHAKRTGGFLLTQLSYLLLFGSRNLRAISVILDTPP